MIAQILHPGSLLLRSLLGLETGSANGLERNVRNDRPGILELDLVFHLVEGVFGYGNDNMLADFDSCLGRSSGVNAASRLAVQLPVAGQIAHYQERGSCNRFRLRFRFQDGAFVLRGSRRQRESRTQD